MPNFESPIGNKKIQSQPLRELDVPDESGYTKPIQNFGPPIDQESLNDFQTRMGAGSQAEEVESEFKMARDAKRGKERLSDGARARIEKLIGMVRGTHSVVIEDVEYSFQTLKTKEMRNAMLSASEFNNTVQFPYELRKQILARSLIKVAGAEIEQFLNSNALEAKLLFLDELDEELSNRLYQEYLQMAQNIKNRYAIVTTEDAKEVVENLKK